MFLKVNFEIHKNMRELLLDNLCFNSFENRLKKFSISFSSSKLSYKSCMKIIANRFSFSSDFVPHNQTNSVLYEYNSKVLKIINNISKKNKKKICVGLVSNRADKKNKINRDDEIIYFDRFLKNYHIQKSDNEILAEKSKLIICMSSNLGIELISKGHKVLFLLEISLTIAEILLLLALIPIN